MPSGRRNSDSDSDNVSFLVDRKISKKLQEVFKNFKLKKIKRRSSSGRRGSDQRIIVTSQSYSGIRLTRVEASTDESETSGHHNKGGNVNLVRRVYNNERRRSSSGTFRLLILNVGGY